MFDIFKEHKDNIKNIFYLSFIDLKKTYGGSKLSWFWAILKPVFQIFVYWFTFAVGIRVNKTVDDCPYFLWLLAGLIPWFYISDMLSKGSDAIVKYAFLGSKIKFPVSIIPTFVSLSKLFVHCVLLIITIIIFALSNHFSGIYTLYLLFYMLLMFLFFTMFAIFASCISAISRDFSNFLHSSVVAIFWLSGIFWNTSKITNQTIRFIFKLNPVTYIVKGYRNCLINKVSIFSELDELIYFLIFLFIMTIITMFTYKKTKKHIPDVL